MAVPKYRLEALLKIKARLKKRAEMALARAILELKQAKEKLEKLKEQKRKIVERWKEARAEMKRELSAGIAVKKSNVHVNYLRKLKEQEEAKQEEIEDQEAVVEECEASVAMARRDYVEAAKQHQIMEKHKELWEKKVRNEISRKEEREMDELGSTIHQLRRWRGEKSVFET